MIFLYFPFDQKNTVTFIMSMRLFLKTISHVKQIQYEALKPIFFSSPLSDYHFEIQLP